MAGVLLDPDFVVPSLDLFPDSPGSVREREELDAFQVFQSLRRGAETTPEQAASDMDDATTLGVPVQGIGEGTREDAKREAAIVNAQRDLEGRTTTQRLLREDFGFAPFVSGNTRNLGDLEGAAKEVGFTGRLSAGIDLLQALNWRFLEAGAELLGLEGVEDVATARARENLSQRVEKTLRITDVRNASDFYTWMFETSAEQLPLMAPSLAGGLAGATAGTFVAGPGIGTVIGGVVGAFIPSFVLGVGETQQAIKERDPSVEAPGLAFGAGALIGMLDSALPGKVGSKLVKAFGVDVGEKVVRLSALRIMRNAGVEGGKSLGMEGVTEAIQEVISESAAAYATDTEIDVNELAAQMIEAFAVGAFMGGSIGVTTSTTTDIIKSRRVKKALDAVDRLKKESKLKALAPLKLDEVSEEYLREGGLEEVFVEVEALMAYVHGHPSELAETVLNSLEIVDGELEAALVASLPGGRGDTHVAISGKTFAAKIIGREGYAALSPHVKVAVTDKSFNEATEAIISDEEVVADLEAELEAYDAAVELKEKVQATLGKMKPGEMADVVGQAPVDVNHVLMDLIQRVEERKGSVAKDVIAGRVLFLQDEIDIQERDILAVVEDIEAREAENLNLAPSKQRPLKALENELTRLTELRDKNLDEQIELLTPAVKAALFPEFEESIAPAEGVVDEDALSEKVEQLEAEKVTLDEDLARAKDTGRSVSKIMKARTAKNKEIAAAKEELGEVTSREVSPKLIEGVEDGQVVPLLPDGSPPARLFRVMSKAEYEAGVEAGEFAPGQEGRTHASVVPLVQFAEPGDQNVLIEIKFNKADNFRAKVAGDEIVAITDQAIPAKRVKLIAQGSRSDLETAFEKIPPVKPKKSTKPKTKQEALRQKKITVKAKVLQDLNVKTTSEAVRAAREAFRTGLKAGEDLVAQKKAVNKVIDKLPVLSAGAKSKLKDRISNARNQAAFNKTLQIVRARSVELVEQTRRREIKTAIKTLLKKSKPKKGGKSPVGTDADVEVVLLKARDIMTGMSVEVAEDALAVAIEADEAIEGDAFFNRLLAMAANSELLRADDAEAVLLDLAQIIEVGKSAALERVAGRKTARDKLVNIGIEATTRGKPVAEEGTVGLVNQLAKRRRSFAAWLSAARDGWDEVLDIIVNKRGVNQEAVDAFTKAMRLSPKVQNFKERILKWSSQFIQVGLDAYGFTDYQQLQEQWVRDAERVNYGLHQLVVEEGKPPRRMQLDYSRAEIRKLWMEYQDPTLRKVIEDPNGMAFSQPMLDILFDALTDQDKAFARGQLDFYRKMYPQVNAVYRRTRGIDLPFNEFYSPIQRDLKRAVKGESVRFDLGNDSILTHEPQFRRAIAKQLLTRITNLAPLKKRSDVGSIHRYMHDMAWFIETSERVQEIKAVFTNDPFLGAIEANNHAGMTSYINDFLQDFGSGYAARGVWAEAGFGYMNRMFTASVLPITGTIGAKQLMSWFAMGEDMPTDVFLKHQADFFRSRAAAKEIVTFLWDNSAAVRDRTQSSVEFEIAKIGEMEDSLFRWTKANRWDKWKFAFIRYGDRFPIYTGGWAVYKHAVTPVSAGGRGLSHTEGIQLFEETFLGTQQSNDLDKLNAFQRMGGMGRTLTLFMTSRLSLLRAQTRAWRQRPERLGGTGKISYRTFGRRMFIYQFAVPMMIQFVASGFRWEKDRQLVAAMMGQLNSVVILGDFLQWSVIEALKMGGLVDPSLSNWKKGTQLTMTRVGFEVLEGIADGFEAAELGEYYDAVKEIATAVGHVVGQPVGKGMNILEGAFVDMARGDVDKAWRRIVGHSETVAEESADADFFDFD
jgi:hypothetical protein